MNDIDLYSHKISVKNNVGYETARDMLQDKVYDLEDEEKSYSNVVKKAFNDVNKKLKKFTGGNVDTLEFPEYLNIENEGQIDGSQDSFIVNYIKLKQESNLEDSDTIKFPEYLDIESELDQQYGGFDDLKFPEYLEIEDI